MMKNTILIIGGSIATALAVYAYCLIMLMIWAAFVG